MDELQSHHWPGNVRKLKNVIEWATIMSNGSTLRIEQQQAEIIRKYKTDIFNITLILCFTLNG